MSNLGRRRRSASTSTPTPRSPPSARGIKRGRSISRSRSRAPAPRPARISSPTLVPCLELHREGPACFNPGRHTRHRFAFRRPRPWPRRGTSQPPLVPLLSRSDALADCPLPVARLLAILPSVGGGAAPTHIRPRRIAAILLAATAAFAPLTASAATAPQARGAYRLG